ncbi:uncharacterized protein MAM_04906 [Metarhizium album ARSEF 1941]|uniref:Non-reducing end beta-L-arabinofuranosidase-like GH127 middle domain-containing protein n=1 Tax=Metarhizium album (strain ARSEF 1941) TaxID=1081103 RepID=A0A0B2WUM2_METAS|nr:uncharacterized protein MAM_04906 [Metarhizium album ARSEF 1941]KHN97309.1 hypothetical protein MAM_04906 [Metarhizium album ARSEF 1941]
MDAAQLPLGALVGAASSVRILQPWHHAPLPLGDIKPSGWLRGESRAMADGLFGHEHDFYVYVNSSSWLNKPGTGGVEYSNLNEALPYWFNSIVPLAYTLDDHRLKDQARTVAAQVLGYQAEDGWIGPEVGDARNFWARTPMLLGLIQLAEADKDSWEKPVVDSLRRFMALANKMLKNNSEGFVRCRGGIDCSWGQVRIHDLIITIQWLLERHPSSSQDPLLWENMDLFYSQNPRKWNVYYASPQRADPTNADLFPYIHGVNVGQGLKASSVLYRINGSQALAESSRTAVDWTFANYGSASGTILADEYEAGSAPYGGSELCTAVETSYSLAYLYQILGDNSFADRAERIIFNAFPVMMTGDKWAHQYMAQPNQPWAVNVTKADGRTPPVFTTANSGLATTFGMEPLYPCCTVNHGQGYAKFVSHSWVRVGEGGLGHALLSPTKVVTTVNDGAVTITCDTAYPFEDTLEYRIDADASFDLYLRVPDWATSYTITAISPAGVATNMTATTKAVASHSGKGMQRVPIEAGGSKVRFTIGAAIRTEARPNDAVAVFFGNMMYALDVGFAANSSYPHAYYDTRGPGLDYLPYKELRDYYITNTKPWNVAIDPTTLRYADARNKRLIDPIFEHAQPPNYMTVDGCEIKWNLYRDTIPDVPPADRTCTGEKKSYRLIPYGAAKVHMSDLPVIKF